MAAGPLEPPAVMRAGHGGGCGLAGGDRQAIKLSVRAWRNGRRKGLEPLSAPGETRDVELPKFGETGHRQSRAKHAGRLVGVKV